MPTDKVDLGNDTQLDEVLTPHEAARYLKVPEENVLKMAKDGLIPSQKIGDEWRFLSKALQDWLRYGLYPHRKGWPFHAEFFWESPFADELLHSLEKRLLHKLKTESPRNQVRKRLSYKFMGYSKMRRISMNNLPNSASCGRQRNDRPGYGHRDSHLLREKREAAQKDRRSFQI